ncbi:MAG: hypothetical protein ACLPXT_09880 [Terracidiphilus sp.]
MGDKGKNLFKCVLVDPKKLALLPPVFGLRVSMQNGKPAVGTPEMETIKFTPKTPNKKAIPACGKFFTPVLRFTAPTSVILAPAR